MTVIQNMASSVKETSVSKILARLHYLKSYWQTVKRWVNAVNLVFSAESFLFLVVYKDSQIAVPPTTVQPKAFYKLGNDSYKLVAQKMKWDEARRQCQADDADLASILNSVTQAYITLQVFKYNEPVWIGLNSNVVISLPVIVLY